MTPGAPLEAVREVFAGSEAWIVGGAVRDRLLGRATTDLDLALPADPKDAALALARATGAAAFRLSGAFGAWRVVGPGHGWHVDLVILRDGDIDADLAARDFTVNAMAEPLAGGELLDPHGGRADLEARVLRMVGPRALEDDPLRALRAVRIAIDIELTIEPGTAAAIDAAAPGLERIAAERLFGELKQVIVSPAVRTGLALMDAHGITAQVLPELLALRGVEQNEFHHLDVHDHTLEVLDQVAAIQRDPLAAGFGDQATAVGELLRAPLADELSRGDAMRFAALLHDAAKPWTQIRRPDGRLGFPGHDQAGAEVARTVMRRLRASEKLVEYVARALPRPPAARVPRARAPARPAGGLAVPEAHRAVRPRGDGVHRRRPARDARQERRPGDRRARGAGPRAPRPRVRVARAGAPGAARARRRAGARARAAARPVARRAARPARGGPLRRRRGHARGRAQARAGARPLGLSDRTASRQIATQAAAVPKSTFAATSRAEW